MTRVGAVAAAGSRSNEPMTRVGAVAAEPSRSNEPMTSAASQTAAALSTVTTVELSRKLPPASAHATLAWNPRRRALTLVCRGNGNAYCAWEWTARGFAEYVDGFFDEASVGAFVTDVVAYADPELEDLIVVGVTRDHVVTAPLSRVADPTAFERFPIACQPYQGRLFATWVKPGEAWLHLPGDPGAIGVLLGASGARAFVRLAEAPQGLVSLGFDENARVLVAVSVMGELSTFDGSAWQSAGRSRADGGMAWHAAHGLVRLEHDPEGGGLQLSRYDGDGFVPVRPKRAFTRFLSGFAVGVDKNDESVVLFGGQDFEKGGGAVANTCASSSGEGAPFLEPRDPWRIALGRYNDAFTVNGALVVATHGERLATYTFGDDGVTRGELRSVAALGESGNGFDAELDDRYIHIAGGPHGTFVFDAAGAVRFAKPGGRLARLVDAPPKKGQGPRPAYAHRTAVVVDDAGCLVVHGPETASDTWRLADGVWRRIEPVKKQKPPRGNTGLAATSAGVYAFVNGELWLLPPDDVWTRITPRITAAARNPPAGGAAADAFRARVLRAHRGKRRLLAVAERTVAAYDADAARFVPFAELPEGFTVPAHTMNRADVVGVDEARDRLVAASEDLVVAIPLASLAAAPAWPAPRAPRV